MVRSFIGEEWKWEECKNEGSSFTVSLHQKLGPHPELRDLVALGVEDTPQYDRYEDKLQISKMLPMLGKEPEVTP